MPCSGWPWPTPAAPRATGALASISRMADGARRRQDVSRIASAGPGGSPERGSSPIPDPWRRGSLIQTDSDPFEEGLHLKRRLAGLGELFAQVLDLASCERELRVELVPAGDRRPEFGVEALRAFGRRLQFGPGPGPVARACSAWCSTRPPLATRPPAGRGPARVRPASSRRRGPPAAARRRTRSGRPPTVARASARSFWRPWRSASRSPRSRSSVVAKLAFEGGERLAPKRGFLDFRMGLREFFGQPADFLPMGLLGSAGGPLGLRHAPRPGGLVRARSPRPAPERRLAPRAWLPTC